MAENVTGSLWLGQTLRAARKERGLSLAALAAVTGIHKSQLSRYESGQEPTLARVAALARALRVSPSRLLRGRP